jgi:hypothetical protein
LLHHVQERFLQEIAAHALDALLLIAALHRSGRGDISQDLA